GGVFLFRKFAILSPPEAWHQPRPRLPAGRHQPPDTKRVSTSDGLPKVDLLTKSWQHMDNKDQYEQQVAKKIVEHIGEPLPWRAWGSWFSWGTPVGLGLGLISVGIFLWLLHLANIIK